MYDPCPEFREHAILIIAKSLVQCVSVVNWAFLQVPCLSPLRSIHVVERQLLIATLYRIRAYPWGFNKHGVRRRGSRWSSHSFG